MTISAYRERTRIRVLISRPGVTAGEDVTPAQARELAERLLSYVREIETESESET